MHPVEKRIPTRMHQPLAMERMKAPTEATTGEGLTDHREEQPRVSIPRQRGWSRPDRNAIGRGTLGRISPGTGHHAHGYSRCTLLTGQGTIATGPLMTGNIDGGLRLSRFKHPPLLWCDHPRTLKLLERLIKTHWRLCPSDLREIWFERG